jgi:hypothetical protein
MDESTAVGAAILMPVLKSKINILIKRRWLRVKAKHVAAAMNIGTTILSATTDA